MPSPRRASNCTARYGRYRKAAPSFERFYLVTSDKEFSLDSIEDFLLSISGISGKIDIEELSNLVGSEVSISDIMLIK